MSFYLFFENFRDSCLENYGLDPCWHYIAPGLTWDAALKKTKVKLELLTDPDVLFMFEKGIWRGVSSIMTHYGKANNKYMEKNLIQKNQVNTCSTLIKTTSMARLPLPTKGFKWMTGCELDHWKNNGCILEVDLGYPKELQDLHNDYPLAPRLTLNKVEKLILNLYNKEKHVVHYENL